MRLVMDLSRWPRPVSPLAPGAVPDIVGAMPNRTAIPIAARLCGRRAVLAGLAGILVPLSGRSALAQGRAVDVALVLGADCSGSVRAEHYVLQQRGYAAAFRNRQVMQAIRSGIHGAIAVTYFQWSGYRLQNQLIPWTVLQTEADILRFADQMEAAQRTIFGGGTSPSGAIEFGQQLLDQVPARPARRVIDLSGDGRNNSGPPPQGARDAAARAGITINGLPILHLEPDIDDYYERNVIGGPGAFLVSARDYASFEAAVRRKLILEIAGLPGPARGG